MPLNPMRWVDASAKFKELLELTEKTSKALAKLHDEVQALKVEVATLKAREEVVIMAAKAAASDAASRGTSELARHLGRIEGQLAALSGQGMTPPGLPRPSGEA